MKIRMLKDFIGVERKGKSNNKDKSFLAVTEVVDSLGIIRFIGEGYEGTLKVGDSVYFGNQRQQIRMQNMDIEVMASENIVAVVEDSDEKDSKES